MQVIPAFSIGGAETMCANLSIELKQAGHEVQVVSLYNITSAITKRLENNDISIVYLDKKGGLNLSIIFKLYKVMKEYKPNVVHTHLYSAKYAHLAASLCGIKRKIHTIHNVAYKDAPGIERKANSFLFKCLGVTPVALSDEVKKTISEYYSIPSLQIPVILNGVPLDKCIVVSDENKLIKHVLHIGRFSEQKNHMTLIKGFVEARKTNQDLELFLYGEGELEEECKRFVREVNAEDYIHFRGLTDDPFCVMSKMDIFILPSLWEGVPMTLIEAMGSAMPIIASNVGGIPNMLTDGIDALLINPTPEEVTNSLLKLTRDEEKCRQLGKNALRRSELFSAKTMACNYLKIYKKLTYVR